MIPNGINCTAVCYVILVNEVVLLAESSSKPKILIGEGPDAERKQLR
jgi:hypothetical protein